MFLPHQLPRQQLLPKMAPNPFDSARDREYPVSRWSLAAVGQLPAWIEHAGVAGLDINGRALAEDALHRPEGDDPGWHLGLARVRLHTFGGRFGGAFAFFQE